MTNMELQLPELADKARKGLFDTQDAHALEEWRKQYIGRSGEVSSLLREVKNLPEDQKRTVGSEANALKRELEELYAEKQKTLAKPDAFYAKKFTGLPADLSSEAGAKGEAPRGEAKAGHVHPLTITLNRIYSIFSAMGFIIADGPEVEEEKYNFDALNIPVDHVARKEGDTFLLDPLSINGQEGLVLRTQTSPMQIRSVETMRLAPPFKVIAPGRVFRREKVDATHDSTFYQFEGLGISETMNIADFKGIIAEFFSAFFQKETTVRLRPSYFPFVEPGFEVDMSCVFCNGSGCRVCKHTGWIEVMGAGMVHPNVLKNMNLDPARYQGFAFGGAVDRLTMIRHGITDIRMFWSGDIRFLKQFS